VTVSLLWAVVAPAYARGLALIGRVLIPVLEAAPDTQYVVQGGRLLATRTLWLPQQQRRIPYNRSLWKPALHYGVPLLAALILATPVWRWRRRGQALAVGLGLLTLTEITGVLVTIVATQQSPLLSPDGLLAGPGLPITQHLAVALYHFFQVMGRGFFALLIYLGLIAFGWHVPALPAVPQGQPVGRNAPCPCGSGRKAKRCCQV
jgi:hypothetical protein